MTSHEACCGACQSKPGCGAWTWNWKYGGDCYLKSQCSNQKHIEGYHSGLGPAPSPGPTPPVPTPTPPPSPSPSPPSPPGPSDLRLSWPEGGGHGACSGRVEQGSDHIHVNGNDITIDTNSVPSGSCVFRNAEPKIDLDEYPHVEVDLATEGRLSGHGQKGGEWFSFWMFPPQYAYKHGIGESGEVDFVENINSVRTNFAGCSHDCHETSWGQQASSVSAHITMHYDKGAQTVNVYRCSHGARTCGTSGDHAYVNLAKMQVQKPYTYGFSADVWYAKPGYGFKLVVSNLGIFRNAVWNTSTIVV